MSGRVGDVTPRQTEALKNFRQQVLDILQPHHDDHYLLRWLRARDFDLKKSEDMLRNDAAWRKRFGADSVLDDFVIPDVIRMYLTGGHCGFDKQGNPIWIDPFGRIDLKGILRSAKKTDVLKTMVYHLEKLTVKMKEQTEKTGKRVDGVTIIYDCHKLGMKHFWKPGVDMFCEIVDMFEYHYPETLRHAFVVNAPRFFPIAYNLVKPFLSEVTASKVQIYGYNNFEEELLKYIDAEELPVVYGGSKKDDKGDTRCGALICQGGDVPKKFYSAHTQDIDLEKFTAVNIGRGSSLQLDFNITVPDSAIRWQFITEGYDLGFGVFKRTKEIRQKAGEMEELITSQRVNSHLFPEDGSAVCQEVGTYVVRFDNTYSWTRSKKIYYQIEVLEPDTEDEFHMAGSDVSSHSDADSFHSS